MRLAVLVVAASMGCHRAPIGSCEDALAGQYAAEGRHWVIIDSGDAVEAYPVFDDSKVTAAPGIEVAPRVIELHRTAHGLAGEAHRRFMQRGDSCNGVAPVHVTTCEANTLELVIADAMPPATFAPCTWLPAAPSHVERWLRQ